jgi:hypothetical protein
MNFTGRNFETGLLIDHTLGLQLSEWVPKDESDTGPLQMRYLRIVSMTLDDLTVLGGS